MLPTLNNVNAFIEITNQVHGGLGWELGTCLWSPVYSRGENKVKSWKLMEKLKPGDIVLHLVDINNSYHWYGISIANSSLIKTPIEPPNAGKWSNMSPYQRINLEYFTKIPIPERVSKIFYEYELSLRQIIKENREGLFYVEYGEKRQLRMSQRYFAVCPELLYGIFEDISKEIGFNYINSSIPYVPTIHEPQNPDFNPPGRIPTLISRIIRDTKLSREVKEEYKWKCQICGNSILLPNNNSYAEGHHLKPLGGDIQGPDIRANIIVLCPTHHAEFDYGSIAINPKSLLVEHIEQNNVINGKHLAYFRTDLGIEFLQYHYNNRYNKI